VEVILTALFVGRSGEGVFLMYWPALGKVQGAGVLGRGLKPERSRRSQG